MTAWLDDHMLGPPCDPRVPGGHRAGIIAPTFGDAVESVVNGPSGLRAINPDVSMVSERGGALAVVWPNGARGRVFGAHTKDDVDRLRAGGGRCLVASTPITLRRGTVPLDQVRAGDEVWTRAGWRRVEWARQTGVESTWRLETATRSIEGTADHLVWDGGRWRPLALFTKADTVPLWPAASPSSGAASSGTGRRAATGAAAKAPVGVRPGTSTARYGNALTAPSPPASTSTIETATSTTTRSPTSRASARPSTTASTATATAASGTLLVAVQRTRSGGPTLGPSPASSAAPSSSPRRPASCASARPSAAPGTFRPPAGTRGQRRARSAAPSSAAPSTSPLGHAREPVLRCSPTGRVEPVWNLEVEGGPPEYLADGILCHNCADLLEELAAWRELEGALANAELGRSLGPHPRAVASTTPRNRAEIRALKATADAWQALATLRFCARILGYWPIFERSQRVILTRATTDDNPYIAQAIRDDLYARYGGSRLGKQELEGELLTDVGTMFSRAWFRLIDALPAGRRPRVRYWDLAATVPSPANEDPDWTAGALVEMDRTTRTFYVLDVERFRASPGEVAQRVEGIARIDGPDVAVVVEQDPGQAGKDQVAQYKERLRHTARVHGERPTGSKALRALLTATAAEAGRVHLLRGDWNLSFLDEHEEFTDDDSHRHDDITDATSGALAVLERGLGGGMSAGTSAAAMTHGRVLRNGGR